MSGIEVVPCCCGELPPFCPSELWTGCDQCPDTIVARISGLEIMPGGPQGNHTDCGGELITVDQTFLLERSPCPNNMSCLFAWHCDPPTPCQIVTYIFCYPNNPHWTARLSMQMVTVPPRGVTMDWWSTTLSPCGHAGVFDDGNSVQVINGGWQIVGWGMYEIL